jgi:hypothetical protein
MMPVVNRDLKISPGHSRMFKPLLFPHRLSFSPCFALYEAGLLCTALSELVKGLVVEAK